MYIHTYMYIIIYFTRKSDDILDTTHYGRENRQQDVWWDATAGSWDGCWICWQSECCLLVCYCL